MKKALVIAGATALLVAAGFFGAQTYADHLVRQRLDTYISRLGPDVEMSYQAVRYDILEKRSYITGISLASTVPREQGAVTTDVTIDEVAVLRFDLEHEIPHYSHARVSGMAVPMHFPEEAIRDLQGMGFDREDVERLNIDGEMFFRYESSTRELFIDRYDLTIQGWMTFRSSVHLASVDLEELAGLAGQDPARVNPFAALAILGKIQLVSTTVDMEVATLANRLIEGIARKEGMDAARLKEQAAIVAGARLAEDPMVTPEMAAFITDFIREPGNLKITLAPDRPVSGIEFFSLAEGGPQLAERLNVGVEKY